MTVTEKTLTTQEVAARYHELAQQEKWFEIQDDLFAEDVKSVEPPDSQFFKNAEGRMLVRKKGEDWGKRIEAVHRTSTTPPVVGGDHFAVGREVDITVKGLGRIQMNEVMLYRVSAGRIVLEQFFY